MRAITTNSTLVREISREASHIWKTMRHREWIKNLFVFAPLFFSGKAADLDKVHIVIQVFLAFSLMSSGVYFFNDLTDRELDRLHPEKQRRPIASGALPTSVATAAMLVLFATAVVVVAARPWVVGICMLYGLLNVSYSLWLKHVVIVDVFCIACGFVLRIAAGGLSIHVTPSAWLIMATFLLSLFLALGKRRHELLLMQERADIQRPVLNLYSVGLVDELISVVTPVTLITYLLYTLDEGTISRFGSRALYTTSMFVVFGIFRYLYLIHKQDLGGSPAELVVKDGPLLAAIVGWLATFVVIVYIA